MRRPRRSKWLIPLIACVLGTPGAFAQSGMEQSVTGAGCVQATTGTLHLAGTLGQPIIGTIITTGRQLGEGFWYGLSEKSVTAPTNPVPGEAPVILYCSPNPIAKSAVIEVELQQTDYVLLTLHDLLGRPVRTLINGERQAGSFTIEMNADEIAAGRYTLTLSTEKEHQTLPVIIAR